MSENSNDRKLFEFYLKYGYFPDDFNFDKSNKKDNVKKTNYSEEYESPYSKEDEDLFLNTIKNLDCTNHPKKYFRYEKIKFKPNIKNVKPEDKLDLHGCTREIALSKIKNFILESRRNNLNIVLIIHGKGLRSENKVAVLKDLVEYYIATEGKNYIKYSSNAPINLGGDGAKIIFLHRN